MEASTDHFNERNKGITCRTPWIQCANTLRYVLNSFLNVPSFFEAPSFADSAKAKILFRPVLETAAAAAADWAMAPLPNAAARAIIASLLATLIAVGVTGVGGVAGTIATLWVTDGKGLLGAAPLVPRRLK